MGDGALRIAVSFILILALLSVVPVLIVNNKDITNSPVSLPSNKIQMAYAPHSPIVITDNSGFPAAGFNGSGTWSDPYSLEGVSVSTTGDCISISDVSVYFVIGNCILTTPNGRVGNGVYLFNAPNGVVDSCVILSKDRGFELCFSDNCTLVNNTVYENAREGILLNSSNRCNLTENKIYDSGMWLAGPSSCIFVDNTICGSWGNGVYGHDLYNCTMINNTICDNAWNELNFRNAINCTILNNTIFGSGGNGVIFDDCINCTVKENTIFDNSGIGVSIWEGCSSNTISGNIIGWNSADNALDNGTNNIWDDGINVGNYWGDYNGTGVYLIPGSSDSVDNYPFKADTIVPTCDEPENFGFEAGTTGNTISWTPSDNHPKSYLVLRNGTYFDSGTWDGGSIIVSVDGLSFGTHNLTLFAYDTCFNSVSDTVLVTVVDTCGPICNNPSDMQIDEGSTGNMIIWTPSDPSPALYRVLRNGTEVDSGVWNGLSLKVSLDGLGLGVYNYTLFVSDAAGNSAIDTVIITVIDATLPTIDEPMDIAYEVGMTGNVIVWHPFDLHPSSYSIFRNDSIVRSGGWDGSAITIVVDGMSPGTYNYTMIVRDVQGNWVSDTVFVTIIALSHSPLTMAFAAGGFGLLAFLALVFIMRRKRMPKVTALAPGMEKPAETKVQALRGCEIVGGKFEYKVKVQNNTNWVITNVNVVIVAYPDDCLQLVGPTMKRIPRIEPDGFRSPQFTFTPTKDCVEGQVLATVTYVDYENRTNMIEVEPYVIRSVCDLLKPRKASLKEFDLMLGDMATTGEQLKLDWNSEVLFVKLQALLPAKNFYIVNSTRETIDGMFKGTIQGLAEGKYTGKKVAVRITVSGITDGNESDIVIDGLGEDQAMLPTTIHELSEGTASWTCLNCGAALNPREVTQLGQRIPIECRYCGHTLSIDLYRR